MAQKITRFLPYKNSKNAFAKLCLFEFYFHYIFQKIESGILDFIQRSS